MLFSCKSKKEAVGIKEKDSRGSNADPSGEIRFGLMFIDGCAYRMKGNLEEAKKLFLECNKMDPKNAAVNYELATLYKLLGVNDQALIYSKACANAEPNNVWYQLSLIESYRTLKLYKQSAKILETLVKENPSKMEFKEDLAIEYQRLEMYDKAFKVYEDLEKNLGIIEELSLRKSKLLRSLGKKKDAEIELIKLSQSNANETRYYSHLADYYIEYGELEKAKTMYDKILSIDPRNPVVNLALHDYYSAQGETEAAFDHLKKAFLNPDLDIYTKASITSSIFDKKMDLPYYREHAKELAEIFIQVHPEASESNAIMGDFMMREGNLEKANEFYFKATIKEKGNYLLWEKLINTDVKLGKYDSLQSHSFDAMEYFPNMPLFYYYNGYANIQLKAFKKASQALKDGLEFVIDNKVLMIDFYKNLGEAYYYSGNKTEAFDAFDNVLKIDADNTFVLNQYAYYLCEMDENLEKAEKLARKANELSLENAAYMDTYGLILYKQKKFIESEKWLNNALKLNKRNPTILEHLGDLNYKLNKKVEALQYWQEAASAGGNSAELFKKIKDKKLDE